MNDSLRLFFALAILVSQFFSSLSFAIGSAYEEDKVLSGEEIKKKQGFFVEYFTYEEYVYSQSKKTELGDNVEFDLGLRYQFNENTFGRLRFETDPEENRFNNKTSDFEFLMGHQYEQVFFQVDAGLNTNEVDSGGTTIGFDLDSELTLISYYMNNQITWTFFPFNFDGEVGKEFNSNDVTRIFFVDGAPASVSGPQISDEKIISKTIPGFEFKYEAQRESQKGLMAYVGVGASTYLYPTDADFDFETSPVSTSWERREDIGYKVGVHFKTETVKTEIEYVGHTETEETGSLLEAAGSIYTIYRSGGILFEGEAAYSKAGKNPYRIQRDGEWFEDQTPFQPIYADLSGNRHEWIGEEDFAVSTRLGYGGEKFIPYLTYKYQGEHFVFRERESAHRLRTGDDSASHGGLNRVGFGAYWFAGDFLINPEFEYLSAKNPVFGNASDVREDRQNATFESTDFLLYLTVSYSFDKKGQW